MDVRNALATAIGSPTNVRVLDNIIVDYTFIDRKIAARILIDARPVYSIHGYMRETPTYVFLTPIVHDTYDMCIELWHASDWPQPPSYVADYDELLEMSVDLLPDDMDGVELHADKSLTHILGFELGINDCECPMLIEMINDDLDSILKCDHIFKRRPIGISWPPTLDGLSKTILSAEKNVNCLLVRMNSRNNRGN